LAARALGADGLVLSDIYDSNIKKSIDRVTREWGGSFFFEMGTSWKKIAKEWKKEGGVVVHLTAYGENIQNSDILKRIRKTGKNILIIVGSQKVPGQFFSEDVSDFNVAVGNQPHSECASLAIFLDRFFMGEELVKDFEQAKMKIIPQKRGKKTNHETRRKP
jgi:tRNA (cytidine56-2'-O)-methyltransferase